jgi:hypothetical protein
VSKAGRGLLLILMLFGLFLSLFPSIASANSAEPPSLVILVNNPPEDLSITLVSEGNQKDSTVKSVAWETYYIFYKRDMQAGDIYTFRITTKGESFEASIPALPKQYNNVYTLELSERELTPGVYPLRSFILVALRLLLTLLIEGAVFWLFRYRDKSSWLVFLIINLITQGILNIWLNSGDSLLPAYLILALIFGELFVFNFELVTFPILIKEHKKGRTILYVLVANILSLIAGGFAISLLPV